MLQRRTTVKTLAFLVIVTLLCQVNFYFILNVFIYGVKKYMQSKPDSIF